MEDWQSIIIFAPIMIAAGLIFQIALTKEIMISLFLIPITILIILAALCRKEVQNERGEIQSAELP